MRIPGTNSTTLRVVSAERRTTSHWLMSVTTFDFEISKILTLYSFYHNSTDIYLEGWGQSFHFCRYPHGREAMTQAMARSEHYLASSLNLKPSMKVLDVGCVIGGPAKEIATFVGCKVTGLNNNNYQLQKGQDIAKKEGVMDDVLEVVKGDFMVWY